MWPAQKDPLHIHKRMAPICAARQSSMPLNGACGAVAVSPPPPPGGDTSQIGSVSLGKRKVSEPGGQTFGW